MGNCAKGASNNIELPPSSKKVPKQSEQSKKRETTVLVVGNIAVGKTTLINCLL